MEIDFLGLHSSKSQYATKNMSMTTMDHPPIPHAHLFSAMESSGVETSLSLATTTTTDFSKQRQRKKKNSYKKEEGSSVRAVFLYDLNDCPGRDVCEIPSSETTPFNMACRGTCPTAYTPDKGDNSAHVISGESSACMIGYRPTVAMARRATLARFLEKRLHRLNQARRSHLIKGKSNNCEGS